MAMIETQLMEPRFDFIQERDKQFIIAFTNALAELGYTYGGEIGSGFCWGRYMLIFRRANVKSKNVVARLYIRENDVVLRLFLNKVSSHAAYLSAAPELIRDVFLGDYGTCKHCKGDNCKFRKDYEIDGVKYEKCNGTTFEFHGPTLKHLSDYLDLFLEFYPAKRGTG